MILRLALKNLRANPRLSLFFTLNLVLGLSGFLAIDGFKRSFESSMKEQSKLLLGADLVISSRRALKEEELRSVREIVGDAQESRLVDLLSMLRSDGSTRLADVQAIDSFFPFYGRILLEDGREIKSGDAKTLQEAPRIWLAPELSFQLGVKVGDRVRLGEREFRVDGIVKDDTGQSWKGFSLAPSAYIGFPQLTGTGLVREGTSLSFEWFYRFSTDEETLRAQNGLLEAIEDPGIRIASHEKASERVSRVLDQVNDYLGLVALVGLFLSSIGAAYLFRSFLASQIAEFGILQVLGLKRRKVLGYCLLQISLLGAVSGMLALLISAAVQPFFVSLLSEYLASPIHADLSWGTSVLALLLGVAGAVVLCLPLLGRLKDLRPNELFQEGALPTVSLKRNALAWIPAGFIFSALAFQQANSWKVAGAFTVSLAVSFFFIGLLGLLLLRLLGRFAPEFSSYEIRLALKGLTRARLSTLSAIVAIALGATLLNVVPQLERNLARELTAPTEKAFPSLFLFDIQDEQVEGVTEYFRSEQLPLDQLSPMVRARLSQVNGKPFERDEREYAPKTREEAQEARSRNRTFNLTYREKATEAETIVEGRDLQGRYDPAKGGPSEVTLEQRFAERVGLKIGDSVEFDVLGVPVQGKVVGLRRVNWLSFQPNFFIVLQPGSLDDAPKVWLAALPKLPLERKLEIQNGLVERFPNISILDVENTVAKTAKVFGLVSRAIGGMAIFSLVTGFAVLFSMSAYRARERRRDLNLLKVLGSERRAIYRLIGLEMLLISGIACVLGAAISFGFSWVLVKRVFDVPWEANLAVPLSIGFGITLLSLVIGLVTSARVIGARPIELLQDAR